MSPHISAKARTRFRLAARVPGRFTCHQGLKGVITFQEYATVMERNWSRP
jgi:hypothetical protein